MDITAIISGPVTERSPLLALLPCMAANKFRLCRWVCLVNACTLAITKSSP